MSDFERTEYGDAAFGAIGRLLAIATRFEGNCKALAVLLGCRDTTQASPLRSRQVIESLAEKILKLDLYKVVRRIAGKQKPVLETLDAARLARNEVAHDLAKGLDRSPDSLPQEYQLSHLARCRELAYEIAEADTIVSLVASVLTGEPIPYGDVHSAYAERVADWVWDSTDMKEWHPTT